MQDMIKNAKEAKKKQKQGQIKSKS